MSYLVAAPEVMSGLATDIDGIGSALDAALGAGRRFRPTELAHSTLLPTADIAIADGDFDAALLAPAGGFDGMVRSDAAEKQRVKPKHTNDVALS